MLINMLSTGSFWITFTSMKVYYNTFKICVHIERRSKLLLTVVMFYRVIELLSCRLNFEWIVVFAVTIVLVSFFFLIVEWSLFSSLTIIGNFACLLRALLISGLNALCVRFYSITRTLIAISALFFLNLIANGNSKPSQMHWSL